MNQPIKIAILAFLFMTVGCKGAPRARLADIGYSSELGLTAGYFHYAEEGPGAYFAASVKSIDGGRGTDYTGILGKDGFPGDEKTGEDTDGAGLSAGVTFSPARKIGLYAGMAFVGSTTYCNFYDSTGILDPSGHYHVECDEESTVGLELGAHYFVSEKVMFGLRHNTEFEATAFVLGFGF